MIEVSAAETLEFAENQLLKAQSNINGAIKRNKSTEEKENILKKIGYWSMIISVLKKQM